jgi:ornithine cyclodeaminase/alanine dehydrogenase-like protein (mu-crystallin family)
MSEDALAEALILDRAGTEAALEPGRLIRSVERALIAIARDAVSSPPRIAARSPHGLLGAMPGHVPGLGLAAKLITVFADPARPGRSAHRGLVAHFDERTGRLLALLDAEPLTAARTAAVSVLALRALARPDARRIAVLGTGAQADAHLALLNTQAGDGLSVTGAGRDERRVRALAERHGAAAADMVELP